MINPKMFRPYITYRVQVPGSRLQSSGQVLDYTVWTSIVFEVYPEIITFVLLNRISALVGIWSRGVAVIRTLGCIQV